MPAEQKAAVRRVRDGKRLQRNATNTPVLAPRWPPSNGRRRVVGPRPAGRAGAEQLQAPRQSPLYPIGVLKLACLFILCIALHGQNRDLRIEPIDPAARRSFEKQVKVALVVGISVYPQGSGLSSLKYAARDADVLGAALKAQGYLVRKLVDSDATRAMIRRTLRELSDVVSPDEGTLLFFFGGHGFTYKGTNYLATAGVTADDLDGEGLAVKDVESLLLASKAKRKLLFVDACRNEPGQGARLSGQRSFDKLQASEGIRVLFSTKEGRVSFEDDALKQGIFTYFLVKGLEGEAAGSDGLVTFRDLADYLTDRMRAYTVERGQVQIPFEAGESSGDFLMSVGTKAGRLPPAIPAPVAPQQQKPVLPPGPRELTPAEKEKASSVAFLSKAAGEKGAVRTASGLIYRQMRAGTGASPNSTDTVKVHYRATLVNGKEFDSSYKRQQPAKFPLKGLIPCWREGVQKMKVGEKARLICPPEIAYGDKGNVMIPAGATLIFEVELLDIEPRH